MRFIFFKIENIISHLVRTLVYKFITDSYTNFQLHIYIYLDCTKVALHDKQFKISVISLIFHLVGAPQLICCLTQIFPLT